MLDRNGVQIVKKEFPATQAIQIVPPSISILEQRLRHRGSLSYEELQFRLQKAAQEFNEEEKYPLADYKVENADLDTAISDLIAIIKGNKKV